MPESAQSPPTYAEAGAEARLLLEVAPAAWLRPQPPEPGPSHQLRLWEINICAGIGQCQARQWVVVARAGQSQLSGVRAGGSTRSEQLYKDHVACPLQVKEKKKLQARIIKTQHPAS